MGLGIRSNEPQLIRNANELFKTGVVDFAEIFLMPGTSNTEFSQLEMPLTIHAPHDGSGLNLCEPEKTEFSVKCINEASELADELNAKYVAFHPGHIGIKDDYENAMKCMISEMNFPNKKKLCVENLTYKAVIPEMICTCHKPEDIKRIMQQCGLGFCLDLNHAYKAAASLKANPKDFIKKFMALNPSYFHLSDGNSSIEDDEHLMLGKGDYDLKFLKKCIMLSESKMVVIETRRQSKTSFGENARDIMFLRDL